MTLPRFEYVAPKSIEETLTLMASHGPGLEVIAGGTEITSHFKHRLITPSQVLSLRNVRELYGITMEGNEIVIGAMTTLREVARSPIVASAWKGVCMAADSVGAPPTQNMGTIGGNVLQNTRCFQYNQSEIVRNASGPCMKTGGSTCLVTKGTDRCRSVYQGDMAPALIACNAKVKLQKAGASSVMALESIFSGSGQSPFVFGKDELLTEVRIPVPAGRHRLYYKKLRLRSSLDYPLASAAVSLSLSSNATIEGARLVVGACGPSPILVTAVGEALLGNRPGKVDVAKIMETVSITGEPINNLLLPASYRRKMFSILAVRALDEALHDIGGGL